MDGETGLEARDELSDARMHVSVATNAIVLFEVTGGLHAGARLAVEVNGEFHSIGSNVESDIVLRDEGVTSSHARLRLSGSSIEIEALGGDVVLERGIIPPGHGQKCRLPLNAGIGGATLRIARQRQETDHSFLLPRRLGLGLLGLVGVFVLCVVANQFSMAGASNAPKTLATAVPSPDIDAAGGFDTSTAVAARDLARKIEEAGIGPFDIRAGDGRIRVSGTVPRDKSRAWSNVRSWFDRTHGAKIMLASAVLIAGTDAAPRLDLQAIWYGERPYIITADGARYHEGAFIEDGWSITRIGEKALVLGKDGATISLTYP